MNEEILVERLFEALTTGNRIQARSIVEEVREAIGGWPAAARETDVGPEDVRRVKETIDERWREVGL